jgi:hypothetical protein
MRWLLAALVLALSAPALADGGGALSGVGRLKVKGCGGDRVSLTWDLQVAGGNFTTMVGGSPGPSGTATPVGNSGQIWSLSFDAPSRRAVDLFLESIASSLCETQVTVLSSNVTHFDLKLNKRDTRGKLTLFVRGTGMSSEGTSQGTLKMQLRGSWQATQP